MTSEGTGASSFLRCLLVRTGEVSCAIPIDQVRRVVRALRVTPVPGAAEELSGIAEFSGEPIAVYDLSRLIGAPEGANPEYPVTVVALVGESDGELVGLNADAAVRFLDLQQDATLPTSDGVIQGEVVVDDVAIRLLDLHRLGGES